MEELVLRLFFGLIIFLGVIGTILPILPGLPLAWIGFFLYKLCGYSQLSWWIIVLFGLFTAIGIILDYIVPIAATKKMGGSKYGIYGLFIGFLVGILFSPFGMVSIIVAPFLGALIGELIYDRNNRKRALKAALGSVVGYGLTSLYGLFFTLIILWIYVWDSFFRQPLAI